MRYEAGACGCRRAPPRRGARRVVLVALALVVLARFVRSRLLRRRGAPARTVRVVLAVVVRRAVERPAAALRSSLRALRPPRQRRWRGGAIWRRGAVRGWPTTSGVPSSAPRTSAPQCSRPPRACRCPASAGRRTPGRAGQRAIPDGEVAGWDSWRSRRRSWRDLRDLRSTRSPPHFGQSAPVLIMNGFLKSHSGSRSRR